MLAYNTDDFPKISSTTAAPGRSVGFQLLQSQMQVKKSTNVSSVRKPDNSAPSASTPSAAVTPQRYKPSLAPVKDFKKSNKDNDERKLSFTSTVARRITVTKPRVTKCRGFVKPHGLRGMSLIKEFLRQLRLPLRVRDVLGDGNCWYRSLGLQVLHGGKNMFPFK